MLTPSLEQTDQTDSSGRRADVCHQHERWKDLAHWGRWSVHNDVSGWLL